MSFKLNVNKQNKTEVPDNQHKVDYEGLNKYLVALVGTSATKVRSIPGVISGIVDLGIQPQEDYDGPARVGMSYPDNAEFYEDEKGKPCVRYTRRPVQQVALTVDFPQIQVDYGKWYTGESNITPYRFVLNGEFAVKEDDKYVRIVGKGYSLKEMKHPDGSWGLPRNGTLFKLAQATGLLEEDGVFKAEDVSNLLGKVAQFQIKVFIREVNGRSYLNENITLAGMVPEGVAPITLDEKYLYGVNFVGQNDPDVVRKLRLSIKNTIRRAKNYEGSDIQKLLDSNNDKPAESEKPKEKEPEKPSSNKKPKTPKAEEPEFVDDDIPF